MTTSPFITEYISNRDRYIAQHPLFKSENMYSLADVGLSYKEFSEYTIPSIYESEYITNKILRILDSPYCKKDTSLAEIRYAIYTAINSTDYTIDSKFNVTLPDGTKSSVDFFELIKLQIDQSALYYESALNARGTIKSRDLNTYWIDKQNDINTDWLASIKMTSGTQHSTIPFLSYWKMNYDPKTGVDYRVLSDWKGGLSYTTDYMKEVNSENYKYVKHEKDDISFEHPKFCLVLYCTIDQCTKLTSGQLDSSRTYISPQESYAYFPGHTASGASPIKGEYKKKKGDPNLMLKTINRFFKLQDYLNLFSDWNPNDPISSCLSLFSKLSDSSTTMEFSPWNYPIKVNKRNQYRGKMKHADSITPEQWDTMKIENSDVIKRDFSETTIFRDMDTDSERVEPKTSIGFNYPELSLDSNNNRILKEPRYVSTLAIKIRDMYPVGVFPSLIQFCWIRDLIEFEISDNIRKLIESPLQVLSATGLDINQMGMALHAKFFGNLIKNLDLKTIDTKRKYSSGLPPGVALAFEIDGKAWDQHFLAFMWICFFSDLRISMMHDDHNGESQLKMFDIMVTLALFSNIKFNEEVPIEVLPSFNPSGVPATKTVNDRSNMCMANYALHKITKGQCTSWMTGTVFSNGDNLLSMYAIQLASKEVVILVEPTEFAYWYSLFNQEIEYSPRDLNFQYHKKFPIKFSGYWFKLLTRRGFDYTSMGQKTNVRYSSGIVVPFQPMPQIIDKYYTSEERVTENKFAKTRGTFEMSKAIAYSGLLNNGLKLLCRGALYDDKIFSEAIYGRYRYGFDVKIPVLDSTGRIVTSTIPIDNYIGGIIKSKINEGEYIQTKVLGFGRESNSSHNWVTSFRMGNFNKYPNFEENHYTMLGRRIIDVLPRKKQVSEYQDPFKTDKPEIYQVKEFRLLCLSAIPSVQQIINVHKLLLNYISVSINVIEQYEDDEYNTIAISKEDKRKLTQIEIDREIKETAEEYRKFSTNKRTKKLYEKSVEHTKAVNSLIHTMYNISKN